MSERETPQAPPKRASRGLKIALTLSVAVNLLIVGLVAGALLGAGPGRSDRDPGLRTLGLGPFALALTREDRAAMRDRFDREVTRSERIALGRSLRTLQSALRTDPFDRDVAEAALRDSRIAAGALQAHGHDALLDQIGTMDVQARLDLADRLGRALRRSLR